MSDPMHGHACSAYCRGEQHAEVFYMRPQSQDNPPGHLRTLAGRQGVRFIHAALATEAAPPDPEVVSLIFERDGSTTIGLPPDDCLRAVPWLLIWQEGDGDDGDE